MGEVDFKVSGLRRWAPSATIFKIDFLEKETR